MKRTSIWSICLVGLLALAGCGNKEETPAASTSGATAEKGGAKKRIAVIPKGSTHEFWKAVHAGAEAAGQELGVEIIWKGPLKEDDRDSQIKVVEDFTSQAVDGIVLAPLDDTALRAPVMHAQTSHIPVVIIDSDLKDVDVISFVATDNFKGGQMAGEEMVRLLDGKGKVVMLRYQEGSASTHQREEGFLDAIKKAPGITVVSDNQYAGATTETAQRAAENLLAPLKSANGGLSIQGIFAPNESSTFGVLRTLQDNDWADKVKLIGFDASPKLVDALADDQVMALVVQNPFNMGYLGVKAMVDRLQGKSPEKRIDTGATLVTRSNMQEPAIAKLIAPPGK
ncbi:MAG: Ribose import binding protein RbsB [Fimbriimonadaceae bacterium]|nr:Ribose import binding protein RbsB [Fimbriimonadaceae bacterium]